jgi:hypothetical protein
MLICRRRRGKGGKGIDCFEGGAGKEKGGERFYRGWGGWVFFLVFSGFLFRQLLVGWVGLRNWLIDWLVEVRNNNNN